MKRNNFPDKTEWNKIVEEAFRFKDDHVFSEHYKMRKKQIQRRITMTKNTGKRKKALAVAAALVAVVVLIPTSVYAYNQITAKISKTADYQATIEISSPAEQPAEEAEQYMFYSFNRLPEGYVERDDGKSGFKNDDTNEAVFLQFYKLPENEKINFDLLYSLNCENYESSNKTAMINYRATDNSNYPSYYNPAPAYDREVYISFNDTPYLLEMIVTENISRDDLLKMIDSVELVPTDERLYGTYIPFLDENAMQSNESYTKIIKDIDNEAFNLLETGNTGSYSNDDYFGGFEFTLNSAEFTDSFDGIYTDTCGWEADYSNIMDENGNIVENIRKKIKLGDGVNSIDEVVSEESIPMHILKVNATVTNTRDETNVIGIDPTLFVIRDGKPLKGYWLDNSYSGYTTEDSITGHTGSLRFFSFDTAPEHKGGKNEVILEPGESAEVQIAFFVADDLKDEVYLLWALGYAYDKAINQGLPVYDVREKIE